MYSVFPLLTLSPWDSNVSLHLSSCISTSALLCSQMTRSSANNIPHGGSFPISACRTSMISIKRSGLNADPWCNPTPTWKYSASPVLVDTRVSQSLYISCIIVTYPLWDTFLPETPPYQFPGYSVVCLLRIYEDHVELFIHLSVFFLENSQYEYRLSCRLSRVEAILCVVYRCYLSQPRLY